MRLALEARGIEPARMADELGVTPQTIHNYLRGSRTPILGVIKQWAQVCRVPWQWITTGELPDDDNPNGGDVSAPVTLWERRSNWLENEPVSLLKLVA